MARSLRNKIGRDEFDYVALTEALSNYASPRSKITSLLRSGEIIRVKKGMYVFGDEHRKSPLCREMLANLIYGPSAVSLETALSYYQMIPEIVRSITSVTTGRARRFETPLGLFTYRPTPSLAPGIDRIVLGDKAFLIALPERALADKIRDDRNGEIRNRRQMEEYLFENLRIDLDTLKELSSDFMCLLAEKLGSQKVAVCGATIRAIRRR